MNMRFNKVFLAGLVLSGSALLAACGGGGGGSATPPPVATTDTAIAIDPATGPSAVQAVLGKDFKFDSGVPELGTTGATTLTLSGSGDKPSFAIVSGTDSATGAMTYGSCIFTVGTVGFPAPHRLRTGGTPVTVTPCTLSVNTSGLPGDGSAIAREVTLVLGTTRSKPVSLTVSISASGVLTVNNIVIGSVVLGATPRPTGATGAGS
jgi:hypothetical protein